MNQTLHDYFICSLHKLIELIAADTFTGSSPAPGNVPPNSLLPFGTATLGALCDHLAKSHVVKHDSKGTCLC